MTSTLPAPLSLAAQLDRAADLGIDSFVRLRLLLALDESPRSLTWLAQHAGISTAAMTGQADSFERAGLAERVRLPLDRRTITIQLTTSGQRVVSHILAR